TLRVAAPTTGEGTATRTARSASPLPLWERPERIARCVPGEGCLSTGEPLSISSTRGGRPLTLTRLCPASSSPLPQGARAQQCAPHARHPTHGRSRVPSLSPRPPLLWSTHGATSSRTDRCHLPRRQLLSGSEGAGHCAADAEQEHQPPGEQAR